MGGIEAHTPAQPRLAIGRAAAGEKGVPRSVGRWSQAGGPLPRVLPVSRPETVEMWICTEFDRKKTDLCSTLERVSDVSKCSSARPRFRATRRNAHLDHPVFPALLPSKVLAIMPLPVAIGRTFQKCSEGGAVLRIRSVRSDGKAVPAPVLARL
ncbi:hypothetical protein BU26DRAFT_143050 [Trematosphaeria pertusa]|uniref:Uncharacterized protein n=1 Tax=Trematosphaeria pertusa TaxID=390896 RepID=A0A6A6IWB5_9PLEO|nr:uncharacterized protein BU26DRAFT_143050 [Trematosphaeria pertusa]KAF2254656.1 hypothetical protein BU26DRAFT_143050 [Trematosphaeria pertusa]